MTQPTAATVRVGRFFIALDTEDLLSTAVPGHRFAHPGYDISSPFLVARDVARDHPALVASREKLVEHAVVPRDHVAARQDAAVAGRDGLDVELVEDRVDPAADRVGRRALEPPVA